MVEFEFQPMDYVLVTVFGVNCRGRIMRAIWNGEYIFYLVAYMNSHNQIEQREFYGDELVPATEEGTRT